MITWLIYASNPQEVSEYMQVKISAESITDAVSSFHNRIAVPAGWEITSITKHTNWD